MRYSLYICEKIIRIDTITEKFKSYCKGYVVKEPAPDPDYCICITEEMLGIKADESVDELTEGFAIAQKIVSTFLLNEDILMMHGAVVAYKDSAFMFTAPSGTGKTTHAELWLEELPEAYIVNGDKPFISIQNKVMAWGSPWCGSEHQNKNEGVELKAICLLERAENNSITEITFEQALPKLLGQIGIILDEQSMFCSARLLGRLKGKVRFYCFKMNNMKDDAFSTSYEQLKVLI